MIEDGISTATSREQHALEQRLALLYKELHRNTLALGALDTTVLSSHTQQHASRALDALELQTSKHIAYLHGGLQQLPAGFASLDSGRPWICFWVIHSLAMLKAPLPEGTSHAGECAPRFTQCCTDQVGLLGSTAYRAPDDMIRPQTSSAS